MGTNYFAVPNRPSVQEPVHIGKGSAGWLFHFEYHNDPWNDPPIVWNNYSELKDWLKRYTVDSKDYVIIDEYDELIDWQDFCEYVENKQNDGVCNQNPDNFRNADNVEGYRFSREHFM